jgi:hypothetical protein
MIRDIKYNKTEPLMKLMVKENKGSKSLYKNLLKIKIGGVRHGINMSNYAKRKVFFKLLLLFINVGVRTNFHVLRLILWTLKLIII